MSSDLRSEADRDPVSERAPAAEPGSPPGIVLLVDADPDGLRALERVLRPDGHRVASLSSGAGLDAWLRPEGVDALVLELEGGAHAGIDLIARARARQPDLSVIVTTGRARVEIAVGCMRRGAFDYLARPFDDVERVRATVRRAIAHRRAARAASRAPGPRDDAALPLSLAAYEQRVIERALDEVGGDATAAARRLGIGRSTFYRKLAKHGVRTRLRAPEAARGVGGPGPIR